jgi:hypothetical protein
MDGDLAHDRRECARCQRHLAEEWCARVDRPTPRGIGMELRYHPGWPRSAQDYARRMRRMEIAQEDLWGDPPGA